MQELLGLVLTMASVNVMTGQPACPLEICGCESEYVRCDGLALKTIPKLNNASTITDMLNLDLNSNEITEINAGDLPPKLWKMDLTDNPVTVIDKAAFAGSSETLTELSFSGARFGDFPEAFLALNALKHLTITYTQINTWRDDILQHLGSTLETLVLDNVGINSWPSWVQHFSHLNTLQLSSASMNVPDNAFDNLANTLAHLNLENASLDIFPSAVSKLTVLEELVLDSNNISQMGILPQSGKLSSLSINDNKLSNGSQLSDSLKAVAASLQQLSANRNKLTSFPDVSFVVNLQSIYLTGNNIFSIGFAKIPPSLTILEVDNNLLPNLYNFMQPGDHLNSVRFGYNSIRDLRGIDLPPTVLDMDISNNLITELTDTAFPRDSLLEDLILDNNPISSVAPGSFPNLQKLTYLSIMNSKLTRLPMSLSSLTSLKSLDLRNNPRLVCTCEEASLKFWMSAGVSIFGDCGKTSIESFLVDLSKDCPA